MNNVYCSSCSIFALGDRLSKPVYVGKLPSDSVVVYDSTLFSMSELFQLSIALGQSLSRIETVPVHLCVRFQVIAREDLAAFATFLLANVIEIGVAKEAQSTEE